MMKIYESKHNVYDAVDAFLKHGVIALGDTTTPAINYISRIKECLSIYKEVEFAKDLEIVPNHGYLYFVYDTNRFKLRSKELLETIHYIDSINPV